MLLNTTKISCVIVTLVALTSLSVSAKKSPVIILQESTIKSPFKISQAVTVADILPAQGKELITTSVNDKGDRLLIIYKLSDDKQAYTLAEQTIIPKQYYRFDVTKLKNEKDSEQVSKKVVSQDESAATQKLYFLSANTLAVYQSDKKNKFKKLAKIDSIFIHDHVNYLSRGNFIQDLNNDAFDDVVIADFDKTHLLIGQGLQSFSRQTLPIKPSSRIFSNGVTYTETKLYFDDVNFDGKTDILLINNGNMMVYPQEKYSQFAKTVTKVSINQSISVTNWWDKRDGSGEKLDQSNLKYRKLEEVRDMNADGIIDLIVRFTKASGVFDRVNDYEIYFGAKDAEQGTITYSDQASTFIHAEGTLTGLVFEDINNDQKLEVLLSGFDIGLSQIIGALVTGAIDQDVYLFKMDEQDNFPDKPVVKKGVELTFSLSSGQTGSAVVKLADLNGDGLKDLVLSDDDDELEIYLGKLPGKKNKHFRKRSISYDTQLPQDGSNVTVVDLNDDGKDDILMQFSRLDGQGKEKELKIILSQ